jgi:hypothetical protein
MSDEKSIFNEAEVNACVWLVHRLCTKFPGGGVFCDDRCLFFHTFNAAEQSFGGRIGIITPYARQKSEIMRALEKYFGRNVHSAITVGTVDGFQGQEKDIIIFSCVRSLNRIGFLDGAVFCVFFH